MVASIPKRTALLPLIADAVSVDTCIRGTTADEQGTNFMGHLWARLQIPGTPHCWHVPTGLPYK